MKLSTSQQMRDLDRAAIQDRGIPSTLLMERAAKGIADTVLGMLPNPGAARAAVFCGAGNNGGDGVAAARLLMEAGVTVRAFLVGKREKMTEDCAEMERRLREYGGSLETFDPESGEIGDWCQTADVLVDAVFGIGLNSPLRGDGLSAVRLMNRCGAPVVAADVPSGLAADTGEILGDATRCEATVTFTRAKPGHFAGMGRICAGRVVVHDIGIPEDLIESLPAPGSVFTEKDAAETLPERPEESHKGNFGRVGILAGGLGYTGAPYLASEAALRAGAGLVFLNVPAGIYPILAGKCAEAMPYPIPDEGGFLSEKSYPVSAERLSGMDACLIGPGLGRSPGTQEVVRKLLRELSCPVVLDADGLNAVADDLSVLDSRRGRVTVLTPHDGEFARLGGKDGPDRVQAAADFAAQHGCVLVRKGHCTITAQPDGIFWLNPTGNAGMAKGGSGDILSGILLALLGQGLEAGRAAALAVWLHGRAGDLCAAKYGETAMLPTDLFKTLPEVLKQLETAGKRKA